MTGATSSPITTEVIADHLRMLTAGDDALAVEILDAYLATEPALLAELAGATPAAAAHKLKSACATLGADALAHAAHLVECADADARDDAVARLAEALQPFRETVSAARAALATAEATSQA